MRRPLIPYLTNSAPAAVSAPIRLSPPIGLAGRTYKPSEFTIEPGHGLVIYSDGLVERRGESIDDSMDRLAETSARRVMPRRPGSGRRWRENTHDDVTIVTLRRP